MARLSRRIAVITGGASGIGKQTALLFAREGAKLCVNYLPGDKGKGEEAAQALCKEIGAMGGEAFCFGADVTQPEQVRAMMARVAERFGGIDILVNNAGILVQGGIVGMSYADIERMLKVDLFAPFVTVKEALPYLMKSRYGRIINVASQLGQIGGNELAAYSAAKAGVIGMTRSLAVELSTLNLDTGILVNAVAPGPIDCGVADDTTEEWKAAKRKTLPLGRYGEPEEVAPTILFLASDDAIIYCGQTLGPNCGDVML